MSFFLDFLTVSWCFRWGGCWQESAMLLYRSNAALFLGQCPGLLFDCPWKPDWLAAGNRLVAGNTKFKSCEKKQFR